MRNECVYGRMWWGSCYPPQGSWEISMKRWNVTEIQIFLSFHESIKKSEGKCSRQREKQEQSGTGLVCLRNSKTSLAAAEWDNKRKVGDEVREVTRGVRTWTALEVALRTGLFTLRWEVNGSFQQWHEELWLTCWERMVQCGKLREELYIKLVLYMMVTWTRR